MQPNSMRVERLRGQLGQIPGALLDVPSGEGGSGNEEGVVTTTVHSPGADSPDVDESLLDAGAPSDIRSDQAAGDDAFDPVFEWGAEAEERIRQLGDASGAAIRQSVNVDRGTDALGHYLSFHVRGAQWGATVNLSGVAYLVRSVFARLPGTALDHARLAFHAILNHELFHFATDVALAQGELAQREAWWAPAKKARSARGEQYSAREEKLANVWMLRGFRTALPAFRVRGKQAMLRAFVQNQPPGYRDALTFRPADWSEELGKLVRGYAVDAGCSANNPLLWDPSYDWACQFPVWPRIDWRNCAIHLCDDSRWYGVPPGWLTFLTRLRLIEESAAFQKQLAKLPVTVGERWQRTKERAAISLTGGQDFKRWPLEGRDVHSIRVSGRIRAHLRRQPDGDTWLALAIGDHKVMGHG